jgi:two-component system chemotaxis response regulator CheY
MKCLVVDDSAMTRSIIVNCLRAIGYTDIVEAVSGERAIEMCTPDMDLVVTDWTMHGMTGVELIRALRANPETASLAILMVTSCCNPSDLAEAEAAGANGYVIKPFTRDVLERQIRRLFPDRTRTGTGD